MAKPDTVDGAKRTKNVQSGRLLASVIVQEHRQTILALAREHGARDVRVFGSAARGDSTADSDLDLLVEFESDHSLLDRIALIQELEDALSIPVDVLTEKALHPMIRNDILAEARPL